MEETELLDPGEMEYSGRTHRGKAACGDHKPERVRDHNGGIDWWQKFQLLKQVTSDLNQ